MTIAAPSPSRGPYRTGEARRREILSVAKKAFADNGYHAASLRDIARHIGVSPGVIIHHFATKEQLLVAILKERDEQSVALLQNRRPEDGIRESVVGLMDDNIREPGLIALFAALTAESTNPAHPSHDYFEKRYEALTTQLSAGIREAAKAGHIRSDVSPESSASLVLALMDGLQLQWLYNRSTPVVKRLELALTALGLEN